MPYVPTVWEDLPSLDTPITAARLNNMEDGISNAVEVGPPVTLSGEPAFAITDEIIGASDERAHIYGTMWNPPASGQKVVLNVTGSGRGTATVSQRLIAYEALVQDVGSGNVVDKAVTDAINNGSGLIRLTATGHPFSTGDKVAVYGVGGVTNANGAWTVTVINSNTLDLQGSTFAGSYTSGGTVTNRPMMTAFRAIVSPILERGGLTGTAANADDVNGFTVENAGSERATDAYYVAASDDATPAWAHGFACDADVNDAAFQFTGDLTGAATEGVNAAMIDLGRATASGSGFSIRLPNSVPVSSRNGAGTADVWMFYLDSANALQFFAPLKISTSTSITFGEGAHMNFGTSTGTKFGTSTSHKIAFWNATPVVQPTGIVDADGTLADITTKFNSLLTKLETIGLIAA